MRKLNIYVASARDGAAGESFNEIKSIIESRGHRCIHAFEDGVKVDWSDKEHLDDNIINALDKDADLIYNCDLAIINFDSNAKGFLDQGVIFAAGQIVGLRKYCIGFCSQDKGQKVNPFFKNATEAYAPDIHILTDLIDEQIWEEDSDD